MYHNQEGEAAISLMKRKLQELYDDQLFMQRVIEQQIINGKRYVFVECVDRQSQQQWQEERSDQDKPQSF